MSKQFLLHPSDAGINNEAIQLYQPRPRSLGGTKMTWPVEMEENTISHPNYVKIWIHHWPLSYFMVTCLNHWAHHLFHHHVNLVQWFVQVFLPEKLGERLEVRWSCAATCWCSETGTGNYEYNRKCHVKPEVHNETGGGSKTGSILWNSNFVDRKIIRLKPFEDTCYLLIAWYSSVGDEEIFLVSEQVCVWCSQCCWSGAHVTCCDRRANVKIHLNNLHDQFHEWWEMFSVM